MKSPVNEIGLIPAPIQFVLSSEISKHVKIGCKNLLYIDLPINLLGSIARALPLAIELSRNKNRSINYDVLYKLLSNAIKSVNKYLHSETGLKWLRFYVSRLPERSRSRLIVKCRIDYNELKVFMEDFIAGKWKNLPSRYDYIYSCQKTLAVYLNHKNLCKTTERVKNAVSEDLMRAKNLMQKVLDLYLLRLEQINRLLKQSHNPILIPSLSSILEQVYISTYNIVLLIRDIIYVDLLSGNTNRIYSGLRRILELDTRSYLYLDLFVKDLRQLENYFVLLIPLLDTVIAYSYLIESFIDLWNDHEYFEQVGKHAQIKSFNDLIDHSIRGKSSTGIVDLLKNELIRGLKHIETITPRQKRQVSKNLIRDIIKENVSWLTLFVLSSLRLSRPRNAKFDKRIKRILKECSMYSYRLIELYSRTLAVHLAEKTGYDYRDLEHIIQGLLRRLHNRAYYVIPYPTIKFQLQYMEAKTGLKGIMNKLYGEYSYFVHPYIGGATIPFLSVLEYKMLSGELKKFYDIISKINNEMTAKLYRIKSLIKNTDRFRATIGRV